MLLTVLGYPATNFNFELRTLCLSALKEFAPEWVSTATSPEYVPSRRKYDMWGRTMGLPSTALLCTNMEFYRAKAYSKIPFLLSCFSAWTEFLYKSDSGTSGTFQQARSLAVNACQPYTNPWHSQKMQRENRLHKVDSWPPYAHHGMHTHKHTPLYIYAQ